MILKMTLDPESIQGVIDKVKKIHDELPVKMQKAAERIAEIGADSIRNTYGGSVNVSLNKTDKGYSVVTQSDVICFLEFGTGALTDSNAEYAQKVSINVYPGSWSEQHAHTYQKWLDDGKDPSKYPFNRQPHYGLYNAFQLMKAEAPRIAKEVFRNV